MAQKYNPIENLDNLLRVDDLLRHIEKKKSAYLDR